MTTYVLRNLEATEPLLRFDRSNNLDAAFERYRARDKDSEQFSSLQGGDRYETDTTAP